MHILLLLSREHDGSEDGDEDEDAGDFKGKQKIAEEDLADLGDVVDGVGEVIGEVRRAEGPAIAQEDEAEQAEDRCCSGHAGHVGRPTAVGSLFFACVKQHDDEDEEHHDCPGVDDDLCGGEKFGSERPVKDGQRHHDHDQRERRVDGMPLQQEVNGSCDGEQTKDDEQCQLHDAPQIPFSVNRLNHSIQRKLFMGYLLIVKQVVRDSARAGGLSNVRCLSGHPKRRSFEFDCCASAQDDTLLRSGVGEGKTQASFQLRL